MLLAAPAGCKAETLVLMAIKWRLISIAGAPPPALQHVDLHASWPNSCGSFFFLCNRWLCWLRKTCRCGCHQSLAWQLQTLQGLFRVERRLIEFFIFLQEHLGKVEFRVKTEENAAVLPNVREHPCGGRRSSMSSLCLQHLSLRLQHQGEDEQTKVSKTEGARRCIRRCCCLGKCGLDRGGVSEMQPQPSVLHAGADEVCR